MTDWLCEILAYLAMASYDHPITAGDGLKRVFSLLASGILWRKVADPTDDKIDIFAHFTPQDWFLSARFLSD